jgi:hypothetical protein
MKYHFLIISILFLVGGLTLIMLYTGNEKMTATGAMCIIIAIALSYLVGEKEVVV